MEKEKVKEQLRDMGFSDDIISQALSAANVFSISDATNWIFSRPQISSSPIHPKINHLFRFTPSSTKSPPPEVKKQPPAPEVKKQSPAPEVKKQSPVPEVEVKKRKREVINEEKPLAERMRPETINEIVGQDHLLSGKSSFIRSAIDSNRLPSFILWGPPGTGKTTIARSIVNSTSSSSYRFVSLSAVTAGVKDVRDIVDEARKHKSNIFNTNRIRTVLFVDEIHRFNKSQLDSFLPVIEDGTIIFIGATTENPSFNLTTPLLSRCRVLTLNPLQPHHIVTILKRAIDDPDNGLVHSVTTLPTIQVTDEVVEYISHQCDGDARVALNALEISAITASAAGRDHHHDDTGFLVVVVTFDDVKQALQSKHLCYDKNGEQHYNLISALHKSMRGSDADASIYWLVRMLEGGEQPLYIARRLIQFSSEDVGLADPSALTHAVSCYQACHFLGLPECSINLAQCVVYLALAPKSVAVYKAFEAAKKAVRDSVGQNEGVPLHLRNAPTKLMKQLGYAKGYVYPPHNPCAAALQSYLPDSLQGSKFLDWPETRDAAAAADDDDVI